MVKFYDAAGHELGEEIIPLANFESAGSLYVNSAHVRRAKGIRFTSLRVFEDKAGTATVNRLISYKLDGTEAPAHHRRPDGSIIEP